MSDPQTQPPNMSSLITPYATVNCLCIVSERVLRLRPDDNAATVLEGRCLRYSASVLPLSIFLKHTKFKALIHRNLFITLLLGSKVDTMLFKQLCYIQTKMYRLYRTRGPGGPVSLHWHADIWSLNKISQAIQIPSYKSICKCRCWSNDKIFKVTATVRKFF